MNDTKKTLGNNNKNRLDRLLIYFGHEHKYLIDSRIMSFLFVLFVIVTWSMKYKFYFPFFYHHTHTHIHKKTGKRQESFQFKDYKKLTTIN